TDGSALNLRSSAGTDGNILATIPNGTGLTLEGISSGWYRVTYNGQTGYVSGDYVVLTAELAAAPAVSSVGEQVVATAKQYIGKPYVYGASGPSSFDCSGFTSYVYKQMGISLNRTATAQLQNGTSVASKDQLVPGDLVFFKRNTSKPVSHVGIYIGDGNFIHASTNDYEVRIDSLYGYYANIYVYGRHIA
ncbi:MAG: peptidoglycan endopeptidase, partial [Clostridia bacterium]|nr:peptidoglycan endopeptidase [Clostridia bacterium]